MTLSDSPNVRQSVIPHTHFPEHAQTQTHTHTHTRPQTHSHTSTQIAYVRGQIICLISDPHNPATSKINQTSRKKNQIVTEEHGEKNRQRNFETATLNMSELETIQLDQTQKFQFTICCY